MRRSTDWILRDATIDEKLRWNELVVNNPDGGHFLQTDEFATIKEYYGWSTRYLLYETPHGSIAALVLIKYVPLLGYLWYFPKGPGVIYRADVDPLFEATKLFIKNEAPEVFLVKIEPNIVQVGNSKEVQTPDLVYSMPIQPSSSTIILAVYEEAQEQMDHLGRRARRYIRRAEREDLVIKKVEASLENFQLMYSLMKTAYGGKGIPGLHPYAYYEQYWNVYMQSGHGALYFCFEDSIPTVGAFVIILGNKAVYKDGGSLPGRDGKGGAYLIHWHVLRLLAAQKIAQYDLWGAPPSNLVNNLSHPLWGIGNFKTAFSKEITDYIGVIELSMSSVKYIAWRRIVWPIMSRVSRYTGKSYW